MATRPDNFNHGGKDGNDNNGEQNQCQVLFDNWLLAKPESRIRKQCHPGDTADDVKTEKASIAHMPHARDKGSESADDGNKAGEDNRLAAKAIA